MTLNGQSEGPAAEGRFLTVDIRSARTRTWLGPAWAVLCGAVASGGLALDWDVAVFLLLAAVLSDPVLGSLWTLVSGGYQALTQQATDNPDSPNAAPDPPYTQSGSVPVRFLGYLRGKATVWRSVIWPRAGAPILAVGCLGGLAVLLAGVLGALPLFLVVVALALAAGRIRLASGRSGLSQLLGSLYLTMIPWLIGYGALAEIDIGAGGLTTLSQASVWAASFAFVYHAYGLIGTKRLTSGATLLVIAQVAVIAALIVAKQPILAGAVGLLLLPQMMLQPAMLSVSDGLWYLRRIRAFTLLATLATAAAMVS